MELDRYHRQTLLPQIGPEGQKKLQRACVLLVGCGALGCTIAEQLTRAGVGTIRIIDRDLMELTNLQRQVLFDERDAAEQAPKAVAAARRLNQINSLVRIEPIVADVHAGNVEQLAGLEGTQSRAGVILDGTDNAETRYLLNDVAVKHGMPWVYGACVGMEGRCMAVIPGRTPCLRCIFPEPPVAGELPTCDTAGVLGAAATIVGSLQAVQAIRLLTQAPADHPMIVADVWKPRFRSISTTDSRRPDCPCCGKREFGFLDDRSASRSTTLCGRNAVQVRPAKAAMLDLEAIAGRLQPLGQVERTPYLVRCELREGAPVKLTVFADGRAIVHGTNDLKHARSIYARFIGA